MSRSIRIAQISDTHISPYGGFEKRLFEAALEKLRSLKPDVVIHCGDLTDNGLLPEYEMASEFLDSIKPSPLVVPGNHDERNYGSTLFREFVGPMDTQVRVGRLAIFLMNSPEPDRDEGRLGRRRLLMLENSFQDLVGEDVVKIVVFHHHLVPVPYSGREMNVLEDAGDVLEMVLRHRVDLVLMGHRHVRRALRIEDTVLVNAGTVSSIRTRGRLGNSFNLIEIEPGKLMRVFEANLTEGVERLLAEYPLRKQ